MTGKRYSAEFKAKVALQALRGELTVSQLVAKHSVQQTMISAWKRPALEATEAAREDELKKLHAKIGQLLVERDFSAKASGR